MSLKQIINGVGYFFKNNIRTIALGSSILALSACGEDIKLYRIHDLPKPEISKPVQPTQYATNPKPRFTSILEPNKPTKINQNIPPFTTKPVPSCELIAFYNDIDGDNFGYGERIIVCSENELPNNYSNNNLDCDDSNDLINPDATELCGDYIDNNCNGQIDENFNVGDICYEGVGECRTSGITICSDNNLETVCDAIASIPRVEECDNLDNNCNGQIDENEVCDLIAFISERDGNREIYVMNGNGDNQDRITNSLSPEFGPSWAPDRSEVVFESSVSGNNDIYAIDLSSGNDARLTTHNFGDRYPDWCRVGNKILFYSQRNMNGFGYWDIWSMDVDGSNKTNLTSTMQIHDYDPACSFDGMMVAYTSQVSRNNSEIYSIDISGNTPINLTNHNAVDQKPTWSPSGTIAFQTNRDGNNEIYLMDFNGNNLVNLTNNPANDSDPSFSSDGYNLVFVSDRDGDNEIYKLNIRTSSITKLTDNDIPDYEPSWAP